MRRKKERKNEREKEKASRRGEEKRNRKLVKVTVVKIIMIIKPQNCCKIWVPLWVMCVLLYCCLSSDLLVFHQIKRMYRFKISTKNYKMGEGKKENKKEKTRKKNKYQKSKKKMKKKSIDESNEIKRMIC